MQAVVAEPMRDAALSYAARGWRCFPVWWPLANGCACGRQSECPRVGKHPLARLAPNGLLDATTDEAIITGWWTQYPRANIGIRTGPESGIWVLDVDAYKGGAYALEDLESAYGKLPTSIRARTGSGGASTHILFRYPTGFRVPSHPIPNVHGLDVKGAGGYIIAAPSLHRSGGVYFWLDEDDSVLEDAPEWLLRVVCTPLASDPKAPVPTGMELDEEGSEEFCAKFFERASNKILTGEARHDTVVWFCIQCKDNAVPFEHASRWLEPLHTTAKEMGGRAVELDELQRILRWAYSKDRRDPLPSVARRLKAEPPPEVPWEPPDEVPGDVANGDDEQESPPARPVPPQSDPKPPPWLSLSEALTRAQDVSQRFLTRIPTLDRVSGGGIPRGRVLLMVGRPGSGKTTLAIQVAVDMAEQGAAVGMLLADEGLNAGAIRVAQRRGYAREQLEAADPDTIQAAAASLRRLENIHCLDPDDSASNLETFFAGMDQRANGLPQVWLLDSAQVIRLASSKGAETRIRVKDLAERVKSEGRKRAAVVILLSQSNRGSYRAKKDEDNSDPLASGGESGALEHMADVFLWLAPAGENRVKALIPKNRVGAGPVLVPWHLSLDRASATFREIDEMADDDPEAAAAETKRLEALRKREDRVIKELKRNPEGLSGKQLNEAVGGAPAITIAARDSLRDKGLLFSEPSTKSGGGMIWKVAR